jgi:hypothetical protein
MHKMLSLFVCVCSLFLISISHAEELRRIKAYVALCDNATQGIAPVPAKIGDGNLPSANLYWGCTDGLSSYFKASKSWKFLRKETPDDKRVIERLYFTNATLSLELCAEAWRGSEITACMQAFEKSLLSGDFQLVTYIGHNVLMDRNIALPEGKPNKQCDAIVLCCKSNPYFRQRLTSLQARPVLLTEQFMYPGAFLLHDAIVPWAKNQNVAAIRAAAAAAYARNQKISTKAALGVFTDLSLVK